MSSVNELVGVTNNLQDIDPTFHRLQRFDNEIHFQNNGCTEQVNIEQDNWEATNPAYIHHVRAKLTNRA